MKLDKLLEIGGKQAHIEFDEVTLERNAVGRARINTTSADTGRVTLSMGYKELYTVFEGMILESVGQGNIRQLWCKSLTFALETIVAVSFRHMQVIDILNLISEKTGFAFEVPDKPYAHKRLPYFYIQSSAKNILGAMFKAFGVADGFWFQLAEGKIFWGDWRDSKLAEEEIFPDLAPAVQKIDVLSRSLVVPVIIGLTPGLRFHLAGEVKRVEFVQTSGSFMTIQY